MENKTGFKSKKLFAALFLVFIFFLDSSYVSPQTASPLPDTEKKGEETSANLNPELEQLRADLHSISAANIKIVELIRELKTSMDRIDSEIERSKNDINCLSDSKRSFESFAQYGDPIGMTAILVGIMTLVLTSLAVITGLGFYRSHRAFERQKDILVEKARRDIDQEIKNYLENTIRPELQNSIDKQEAKFWHRTYIGCQLEIEYWIKLIGTPMDTQERLDRYNKFRLAIAGILSEKNIQEGLGFFFYFNIGDLPPFFGKSMYELYCQGIFNRTEEIFSRMIKNLFHMDLKPWLEKVKGE
jgi:hypothetical protein